MKLDSMGENLGAAVAELTPDDFRDIDLAASQIAVHGARCPEHLQRMTARCAATARSMTTTDTQ
jgi:hypothetical protein